MSHCVSGHRLPYRKKMYFLANEPLRLSFWINDSPRNELKGSHALHWKDLLPLCLSKQTAASLKMCPSPLDSHSSFPKLPDEATGHGKHHVTPALISAKQVLNLTHIKDPWGS